MTYQKERARHEQMSCFFFCPFKSNIRETWRMILVSKADIFLSESLRILAERLSQSEIRLPLRQNLLLLTIWRGGSLLDWDKINRIRSAKCFFKNAYRKKVTIIYRRNRNEKKQKMCANLENTWFLDCTGKSTKK